jgi:D12 class N6 adenine-specific DNA methyltransferase
MTALDLVVDPHETLRAPFQYMGGKRKVIDEVWARFGSPTHYIEPFCGSAAMLLGSPRIASLEVVNDWNGFICNFWRAVQSDSKSVAKFADYPILHLDLGARYQWLMLQRGYLAEELRDPDWPGDAKIAGWWLWGQCASIGGGWCDWDKKEVTHLDGIPYITGPGQGIHAVGGIPHLVGPGRGIQALGASREASREDEPLDEMLTSSGRVARSWLARLQGRLERVRTCHGDWQRCLNNTYGGAEGTAIFLDPPYLGYEGCYGGKDPVAREVEEWSRRMTDAEPELKIALCGHEGDYYLPGWDIFHWNRGGSTFGSLKTTDLETIWFSPGCLPAANEIQEAAAA